MLMDGAAGDAEDSSVLLMIMAVSRTSARIFVFEFGKTLNKRKIVILRS